MENEMFYYNGVKIILFYKLLIVKYNYYNLVTD